MSEKKNEKKKRKKVLIVDDDAEILTQLRWALGEEFDLVLAGSPSEAEALLSEGAPPEAALVDLHLPPDASSIEGGISVIRSLSQTSATTRIIAFSADRSEDADRLTRDAGALMLLNKPIQRERLLELLRG